MEKKNICRPIVLLNKQIPSTGKAITCDFVALGERDGIIIRDNIFKEDTKTSFINIWKQLATESSQLEGIYSNYILFAFRTEEPYEAISDSAFFQDMQNPFLFVVLLQYKEQCFNMGRWGRYVERMIVKNYPDCKAITYMTLDGSDLILLLRTSLYDTGQRIISELHHADNIYHTHDGKNLTLNYSFSIAGFSKKILDETEDFSKYGGEAGKVTFNVIEKSPGSVKNLYDNLTELLGDVLVPFQNLGNDDDIIVWENAPWSKLLPLYKGNQKGLLLDEHKTYRSSVYSVVTSIHTQLPLDYFKQPPLLKFCGPIPDVLQIQTYPVIKDMIYKTSKEIIERFWPSETPEKDEYLSDYQRKIALCKTLFQLLNSLDKFERTDFPRYIFISIREPLKLFLKIMNQVGLEDRKNTDLEFLNSINILIQSSDAVDRNFFQAPDFNAGIYYLPDKLEAFYSSYIYSVTKLYNSMSQGEHVYKFLLCPSLERQTKSVVIYPDTLPGDRVVLIKISEQLLFNPQVLMIILGHEVGHYVGGNIRRRKLRYKHAKAIIVKEIIRKLLSNDGLKLYRTDEAAQKWEAFLLNIFETEEKRYYAGSQEIPRYHSRYMKINFKNIFYNILRDNSENLYSILINSFIEGNSVLTSDNYFCNVSYEHVTESVKQSLDKLQRALPPSRKVWDQAIFDLIGGPNYYLDMVINNIIDIMIECYADLISILALNLNPRQYLESFLETVGNIDDSALIIRISFVVETLRSCFKGQKKSLLTKRWNDEWNALQKEFPFPKLVENISKIMQCYENGTKMNFISSDNPNAQIYKIYESRTVWDYILDYLQKCRKSCESFMDKNVLKNGKMSDTQRWHTKICNIYSEITHVESVETMIEKMDGFIFEYANHIFEKEWSVIA